MSRGLPIAGFAFLIAGAGAPLAGQSTSSGGHAADEEHHFHRNDVAVFLGATTPLDKARGGETSFTAGVEYERRFTRVLGAQALADFSFGDLKREAIFAALLTVRPIAPLRFSLGPGAELVEEDKIEEDGSTSTKNKAYFVIASRVIYVFHVGRISLAPTVGLDFIGETKTSFVYGLSVGAGF